MKTLDEVIFEAPYSPTPWEADAIHYLKEYKNTDENYKKAIAHVTEVIDHYEKMVADYLAVNNPPLTWDELKTLEGKPVWIEHPETKIGRWIVIAKITGRNEDLACMNATDAWGSYWKKYQGLEWQAYRKERK